MRDLMQPYPNLGKYEGELLLVEHLDNSDGANDELGDTETFGHYQFFDVSNWNAEEEGGTIDSDVKAVILETNSVGFVTATYYETVEEANMAWGQLELEYANFCEATEE